TAPGFEVAAHTVWHCVVEAAEPRRAFSASFFCALHLAQVPLDALSAVRRDRKAGALRDDEAIKRLERSPSWVWTVLAPPEPVAGGERGRQPHAGEGAAGGAAGAPAGGARLCPAGGDRWPQGLRHGRAAPFWPVEARGTAPGQRAQAHAPLDAPARVARRAG